MLPLITVNFLFLTNLTNLNPFPNTSFRMLLSHYAILSITRCRDVVEREEAGWLLYIIDERLWDMTYLTV